MRVKMSYEFYALPEEFNKWLLKLISDDSVWCMAWYPGKDDPYYLIRDKDISSLSYQAEFEDSVMFFVGRRELSDIVWEDTKRGKRIHFIKSQAIQIVPSLIVQERILLEGRMAVMRPSEYTLQGIDPKPILRWYKQVRKSLTSIMSREYIIIQRTTTGKIKEWLEVGVTPAAVAWYHRGHLLKQFPQGAVEFDIRHIETPLDPQ